MPKPIRNTVEYFPHYANASDKKTITILQQIYGDTGYAVWFRLLECLAANENHYITCKSDVDWQYLTTKLHVDYTKATTILKTLYELGAIDQELWEKASIIWSANFIKNVSEVYRNRRRELPAKPNPNGGATPNLHVDYTQSTLQSRGSRVEEVKESRVEVVEKQTTAENILAQISKCYESNIGMLTPMIAEKLKDIANTYPLGWFDEAVKEACDNQVRKLSYITAILERWQLDGFKNKRQGGKKDGTHKDNIGKLPTKYTRPEELHNQQYDG